MPDNLFISQEERHQIVTAIQQAEGKSYGEIKVYFEKKCNKDVMDRALEIFYRLDLGKTKRQTGVLFYVAYQDHVFAIIGDRGIHEKVPSNFWEETKALMQPYFIENKFTEGLIKGISLAGEQLKAYFEIDGDDTNEIPDDIIISDE